jgi:chromate reductase
MSNTRIAVVVGSLRKESWNQKLATAVMKLAPADFAFKEVGIGEIPIYNQDHEQNFPPPVKHFRDEIKAADGVLFVTPEYNRSIPGPLKNAIDSGSRPYGQSIWAGKPAGVMGITIGTMGAAMAQQHLRNVLAYLDMPTLGQPEVFLHANDKLFDAAGNLNDSTTKFLQTWMDKYTAWVKCLLK